MDPAGHQRPVTHGKQAELSGLLSFPGNQRAQGQPQRLLIFFKLRVHEAWGEGEPYWPVGRLALLFSPRRQRW